YGIRDLNVTGVQTCALPICDRRLVSPSPTPLTLLFYFLPVLKSDGVHPADHPGISQPQRNTQRIRSYSSKLLGLFTYEPICDHRSEERRVGIWDSSWVRQTC